MIDTLTTVMAPWSFCISIPDLPALSSRFAFSVCTCVYFWRCKNTQERNDEWLDFCLFPCPLHSQPVTASHSRMGLFTRTFSVREGWLFHQERLAYLIFGCVRACFILILAEILSPALSFGPSSLLLFYLTSVMAISPTCFLSILSVLLTFSKCIHSVQS